jgi:hypothetical protein
MHHNEGLFMVITSHSARITGPIPYTAADGSVSHIPLGACLVEQIDGRSVDIVWGERGQTSAALPLAEVEAAEGNGHLILLD